MNVSDQALPSSKRASASAVRSSAPKPWMGKLLRWSGLLLAIYLVRLHIGLLSERFASETLFTPEAGFKWASSVLLLGALAALRLSGAPLLYGRKALVVWTLVLLLHASSGLPASTELAADLASAAEAGLLLVLPILVAVATLFELGLWPLARRAAARASSPRPWRRDLPRPLRPATLRGYARHISSRPPPA